MTRGDVLQRLEALLDRVRTRAAQPRVRSAAALAVESDDVQEPRAAETETTARVRTADLAADDASRDSRERMVAAEVQAPPEEPAVAEPAPRVMESAPPIDVAELEVPEEEEQEEAAPLSSRRPVAPEPEERIAQIAFGADEPRAPIHTPPPESGRLPAAPVAEFEPDPDHTGVRSASPLMSRPAAQPEKVELVPEAIRPEIPPSDSVAEVIAEVQRFSPTTFVALLEASLEL